MMGDEWQLHTSQFGYALTGRKSIADQRLKDVPQLQVFIDAMLAGKARPRSSEYPAMTEAMQLAFDESIFGTRPPQEAMSDAAKKIEEALQKESTS
jgi:maltose-binding protein MalE